MKEDRELLKGSTPTLILAILSDGPRHGYAITREIARRTSEGLNLGEGSIYPSLRALEQEGFIIGAWEPAPASGPPRRVYSLSDTGQTELKRRTQTWRTFVQMIESVITGRSKEDATESE